MRFYRQLRHIAALTFDLDDTLYDNHPVITRTEQESLEFVRGYHPRLATLQAADFQHMRQQLRTENPDIYHDVTEWRRCAVEQLMLRAGLNASEAQRGSGAVMAHFASWRSRIEITEPIHRILERLAQKWPLAVITNGNAEPHLFGISQYFRFVLRSGPHGRAKPFSDMYALCCEKLALPASQIMHIGDDLTTDIAGAINYNMQTCWINPRGINLLTAENSRLLPHLEISCLASLVALSGG